jgi:hypothetical protein
MTFENYSSDGLKTYFQCELHKIRSLLLKIIQMKRDDIYIMLLGFGISVLTAFYFFSNRNELIMNKFVISINKSFHFNLAPMVGISFMAAGEFILWESQHNDKLIHFKAELVNQINRRLSGLPVDLKF